MQALSLRAKLTLALLTVGIGSAVVVGAVARMILRPHFDAFDESYLAAMQSAMLYGVGVASLLALALGLIIGARLSRRLRQLTTAITAMSLGDLYQHVDERGDDEV